MNTLIKPVITEKFTKQADTFRRYAFVVDKRANKLEIKNAVQEMYGVQVLRVNTQQYLGKVKMRNTTQGLAVGRVFNSKKAIVTLKEGDAIDFYASI